MTTLSGIATKLCWLVLGVVVVLLVLPAVIATAYNTDNLTLVSIFSRDEMWLLELLEKNLQNDDLNPRGFYYYGYFFNTVGFVLGKAFQYVGAYRGDTRFLGHLFRLVSVLSFVGLLYVIERSLARLSVAPAIRYASVLLVAAIPTIYQASLMMKPEILQAFLMVFAFYILTFGAKPFHVLLSATVAGVAFGTKLAGVFLLPVIVLAVLLTELSSVTAKDYARRVAKTVAVLALVAVCFLGGAIVTNPYVYDNFDAFMAAQKYNASFMAEGGTTNTDPGSALLWFPVFYSQFYLGGSVVMALGILLYIVHLVGSVGLISPGRLRRVREFLGQHENVLVLCTFLYCLGGVTQLMVMMHYRDPRYAIHIMPFAVILCGYGYSKTLPGKPMFRDVMALSTALVLSFSAVATLTTVSALQASGRRNVEPTLEAGSWLTQNYDPTTVVLSDVYGYVRPDYFEQLRFVWGVNREQLDVTDADVILLTRKMSGRFSWKRDGTVFSAGDFVLGPYDTSAAWQKFHTEELLAPDSPWVVRFENSAAVILENVREAPQARELK